MAAAAALLEMQRKAASWTFDTEKEWAEAVARAKAATSGDPLRVAYIAWQLVEELECCNRRFEAHLLQAAAGDASARQAVREELDHHHKCNHNFADKKLDQAWACPTRIASASPSPCGGRASRWGGRVRGRL